MLNVSVKPTFRRVGALCLIALGMTVMSCNQEPVMPAKQGQPNVVQDDDGDQPPKDVGNGH